MNMDDDILWTALSAARPDPGYEPSPHSPGALQIQDRVLGRQPSDRRVPARRLTNRRIVLAAFPAVAVAITVAFVAVSPRSPGTARPTVATVRTAILDAWQQHAGDIYYWSQFSQVPGRPALIIRHGWSYPAFPAVGQMVRFRELNYTGDGRTRDDTESFYRENAAMQQLSMPTAEAPPTARIVGVDYLTRTWSECVSHSYPLDAGGLGMSPAMLRAEIEHGALTLDGTVNYAGREALKLSWATGVPGEAVTMLVDARTYEPLRSTDVFKEVSNGRVSFIVTVVFALIPATPSAFRVLTPPVPAGFARGSQLCH